MKTIKVGDIRLEVPDIEFATNWEAVNAGIKLLHARQAVLRVAIDRLLEQLNVDENHSGGLLSRETHRIAGELRLEMAKGDQ